MRRELISYSENLPIQGLPESSVFYLPENTLRKVSLTFAESRGSRVLQAGGLLLFFMRLMLCAVAPLGIPGTEKLSGAPPPSVILPIPPCPLVNLKL